MILQWRDPHFAAEVEGERALVVEAEVAGDFADVVLSFAEEFAGGLDAAFDDKAFGRDVEGLFELPVELSHGEVHHFGEFGDEELLAEIVSNEVDGFCDLFVGTGDAGAQVVILHSAHDADDFSVASVDWEFVGDEPVGDSHAIEEKFDEIDFWLAAFHHGLVVGAEVIGHAVGEEIEIRFADDFGFLTKSKSLEERTVGPHDLALPIFNEEGNLRQVFEQLVKVTGGIDAVEEDALPIGRGGG